MASKQPLIQFEGSCELKFKLKAVSNNAAERKALESIRSIYKDVKVVNKRLNYLGKT